MVERDFEMALDRMYAEAPAFADADLFALRIDDRLNRGWTFRRLVIGGLGVAGGAIGGGQLLSANFLDLLKVASAHSTYAVSQAFAAVMPQGMHVSSLSVAGQVIWMSVAMAAAAIGLALTRLVREI